MILPEHILACLNALEDAGYAAYCVGGCVRDSMLGLTPHDYDICTAALPEQTETVFADKKLDLKGKIHGTVVVFCGSQEVEITTFRTEGDYQDNRHPGWVRFVPDVEQDLARRDFTVNAMAWSPRRGLADPFGGQEDLKNKVLRAVGDPDLRFREDSLRILRGLRFAVRFGLTPDTATFRAMTEHRHLLDNLARERVFPELCQFLTQAKTAEEVVTFGPILAAVIPELEPMLGFDQCSPHHAYDVFTHTAHVVVHVPPQLALRWAALLHDVGKVPTFTRDATGRGHFHGHAQKGAEMADVILRRLKAPTALRERVVFLTDRHMFRIKPEKKELCQNLRSLGEEALDQLLTLQEADMCSKKPTPPRGWPHFLELRDLLAQIRQENTCLNLKDLAVNGRDLTALGFRGKAIGRMLETLLDLVTDEQLPNEKDALLQYILTHREESL